ncbi:MAG: hypothetical protein MUE85_09910 [Microscillaceae bacterium]|jgi:hypothetical protein|nr:hypothetical protein [Microscillaceae bacterium]
MKTLHSIIYFITFFILNSQAFAQDFTFKVIASSGASHKNTAGKEENKLKLGSKLVAGDKVVVAPASYLGLTYAKGGTVQISVAGTYSVKDLETKLLNSKKSVTEKYANFIIGEMTKGNGADIHKNPYKYQNVTGSVERGFSDLVVMLPKNSKTFQNEYKLQWYKVDGNKTFTIKITDFTDELIKTVETTDTTWVLKWDAPEFKDQSSVQVKIIPKEKKLTFLTKYSIERLESEDLTGFQKQFKDFETKEIGNAKDANALLNRAVYLEENEMYIDALYAYTEARKLEPKNEIFEIVYNQFLIRRNIGPAEQIKKLK